MSWMFMPHRALTPAPLVALLAAAVLCARLGKGHGASMVDVVLEPAVPAEVSQHMHTRQQHLRKQRLHSPCLLAQQAAGAGSRWLSGRDALHAASRRRVVPMSMCSCQPSPRMRSSHNFSHCTPNTLHLLRPSSPPLSLVRKCRAGSRLCIARGALRLVCGWRGRQRRRQPRPQPPGRL